MKKVMITFWILFFSLSLYAFDLEIPAGGITPEWLTSHLKQGTPRLILTPESEIQIKSAVANGGETLAALQYQLLKKDADELLEEPVLERIINGRRLLGVSRNALYRVSTLALVYRTDGDRKYLDRLEKELDALCEFSDWHPSHFLDVAEMTQAVALGIDWCGNDLQPATVAKAKTAIIEKGLKPGLPDNADNFWVNTDHNWNQVCHGGLSAGAIVVAEVDPALTARILSRSLEKIPLGLHGYAPDGAYIEGPSYWGYGTAFTLLTISMFNTAFGTDFGISEAPGFVKSADYRFIAQSPTGGSYNYFDSGNSRSIGLESLFLMNWFAGYTGDALYLDRDEHLEMLKSALERDRNGSRFAAPSLVWLVQFDQRKSSTLPNCWAADGPNPVAIIRDDAANFFLGLKGGSASLNHGNMDAGSFVLDMNGVRWSVDPGNQSYDQLEKIMGVDNLWGMGQDSPRWNLLSKNNMFHSTLSVNKAKHNVAGTAKLLSHDFSGPAKTVTLDMQEIFSGLLTRAERTFTVKDHTVRITDKLALTDSVRTLTWAFITQADVMVTDKGAILSQDGKKLAMTVIVPDSMHFSVISLDPPPLSYDKVIDDLKRVELEIPRYIFDDGGIDNITVEISALD